MRPLIGRPQEGQHMSSYVIGYYITRWKRFKPELPGIGKNSWMNGLELSLSIFPTKALGMSFVVRKEPGQVTIASIQLFI